MKHKTSNFYPAADGTILRKNMKVEKIDDGLIAIKWSRQPGSNRSPARYECAALPDELCRLKGFLAEFFDGWLTGFLARCRFHDVSDFKNSGVIMSVACSTLNSG